MEEFTPRNYQLQLEEIALRQNTIINLPTGSGKTYIAIRVINNFAKDLKKPWGEGGKRTFFLVNNVPLVTQHKKAIEFLCHIECVGGYSSTDRVDYWNKGKWDEELSKHQVIVMTAQILADMLQHCYIRMQDINLLIVDECHHGVVDHPMRVVMRHLETCPSEEQPRILGLTATLLNGNVKVNSIENTLRDLETTYHATIATLNEFGEVTKYSTNPIESQLVYGPCESTPAMVRAQEILSSMFPFVTTVVIPSDIKERSDFKLQSGQKEITNKPLKINKELKNMIVDMIDLIEEMGEFGGSIGILAYMIVIERIKRKATPVEADIYNIIITKCMLATKVLEDSMPETGFEKVLKHSSPHVLLLLKILKEYNTELNQDKTVPVEVNTKRSQLNGIIFTRKRMTAKILFNILKEVCQLNPQEYGFIKHDFLVGFQINPFKCTREQLYTKKLSAKALIQFSNGDLNCIISTNIIEEGVDIPRCTLVVMFDKPMEYRSYIQSKGRARSAESNYVLMVAENDKQKFLSVYTNFKNVESRIEQILVGKTNNRMAPSDIELQNFYEDESIPPYVNPHSGSQLISVSATSLLNRYCNNLPHDQYTVISPYWILEKQKDGTSVVLVVMPIGCPIKDSIRGMPMKSLKDAIRSAALNACIALHQEGCLDSTTMLPVSYGKVEFELDEVKECFPNWPADGSKEIGHKTGTKKKIRKHNKVYPACLNGPEQWTSGSKKFYLHLIDLKPNFKRPTDSRDGTLYDFLHQKEGFGFITLRPLPNLCDFPMFMKVGEVTTSIKVNIASLELSFEQFELIKRFHLFVFDSVLEVAKRFLVSDPKFLCLYVVPLHTPNYTINWDCINTYYEVKPAEPLSVEDRKTLKVTKESYLHSVVTPWYRNPYMPDRYVVTNVLEYKTPHSPFDSDSVSTYAAYYKDKYSLTVMGPADQPLLEVRNIRTKRNCLLPQASTLNTLTPKQVKQISQLEGDEKVNSYNEDFIPEFCFKNDFPGLLWFKSTILPSIIHRTVMMLGVEELRVKIATEANLGTVQLPVGEHWKPIMLNMHIATKALVSMLDPPSNSKSIDRINNPIDEHAPRPVNTMTMKESLYKNRLKKLNDEYPWLEASEPLDLDRNVRTVTVLDVECYHEFASCSIASPSSPSPSPSAAASAPASAPAPAPSAARRALPEPKYETEIKLLSQKLGSGPQLSSLMAALTTTKCHDAFDLERVETLGDSFLKYAASLYLFHKFPKMNEGQLTNIKSRLIGNRNLYYAGERISLGGRMKTEHFAPSKDFVVPGFSLPPQVQQLIESEKIRPTFLIGTEFDKGERLSGKISEKNWADVQTRAKDRNGTAEDEPDDEIQVSMQCYLHKQAVRDKSVADCVEALLGTYLLSDGIPGGVRMLEWLRVFPAKDNFLSYLDKPVMTVFKEGKVTVQEIDYYLNNTREDIEKIIGYKFKDPSLLLEAMSHSSYIKNRVTRSYERLEFLGDAVLDFLITAYMFEQFPGLKPGEITDLRSALVNNVTFAAFVVKLGLHKYICYQINPALDKAIMAFVEHQKVRDHKIEEDVIHLIDEEDCQGAEYVDVPKMLSDVLEALAGAVLADGGGPRALWRALAPLLLPELRAAAGAVPRQPVRLLHERVHACPRFGQAKPVSEDIPKIMVPVTITKNGKQCSAYGFGNNKFQAKRAAAKLALKILSI